MPLLVNIVDYKLGERHAFEAGPVTIGRLSKNDIPIKNKQISRQHAKIMPEGGGFTIEDMNSTNYVYVNRAQTAKAPLKHGDLVNVGGVADFLYLDQDDPDLAHQILEDLKNDPEYSPANFALKKTMASLVDELSQSQITTGLATDTSTLEDIEHLYEIAYSINSTLNLEEVLNMAVQKVLSVTGGERGFVMLKPLDREVAPGGETPPLEVRVARTATETLTGNDRTSYSQTIVHKALESGETYVSTNAAEDPVMHTQSVLNYAIREVMCAPLRVKDDIIGTIYVDTRQVAGNFSKRDILFFEAICHQAAIALANARMTEDLRHKQTQLEKAYMDLLDRSKRLQMAKRIVEQKVKELSALNAVATGMNVAGGDLNSLVKLVLDKCVEVLACEWGCLLLLTEDEDELQPKVYSGLEGPKLRPVKTTSETFLGEALKQGKVLSAAAGDQQYASLLPADLDLQVAMAVPLIQNRRKIGAVFLANPHHQRPFSKEEQTLASTLASSASVTIENTRLYNMAIYDGLTSLHDRRYFDIWLKKEFDRTKRYKGRLSLVLLDVDHFKQVNDVYGHTCGDLVLRTLAALIRDSIRTVDLGARYGGEEFAVILPETEEDGAMLFAERLRGRVEQTPIRWEASCFPVTISCGVATLDLENTHDVVQFINDADKALYFSKESGRNRVTAASSMAGAPPRSRDTGSQPAVTAATAPAADSTDSQPAVTAAAPTPAPGAGDAS